MASEQPNNPEYPSVPESDELNQAIEKDINPPPESQPSEGPPPEGRPPEGQPEAVETTVPKTGTEEGGLSRETIHQQREFLARFNNAREEYTRLENQKRDFTSVKGWAKSDRRKMAFAEEYNKAKKNYETLRAEYYQGKIQRFLFEDSRLERALALGINPDLFKKWLVEQPAGAFNNITVKNEDGEVIGAAFNYDAAVAAYQKTKEYRDLHGKNKVIEKTVQAYKWLGEQNLEKTGWGKNFAVRHPRWGRMLLQSCSLRMAAGWGLFGAGVGAGILGGGVAGLGILAFRRVFSGVSSTIGVNEIIKAAVEHKTRAVGKERVLNLEEIKHLDTADILSRLQSFAHTSRQRHEDVAKSETYQALKREFKHRFLAQSGKVKDADTAIEEIMATAAEFDNEFAAVARRAKSKANIRRGVALAFGVAVGSGLLGKLLGVGVNKNAHLVGPGSGPGAGLSPEMLEYGREIDRLSPKFFGNIPNVTDWPPQRIHSYVDFLRNLEQSFSDVKTSGAWGPEEWRAFIAEHEEMFKGGRVPSIEEITTRLNKDIQIETVAAGEGIEHKGIQQILDNPRKFGYEGDLNDARAVKLFANTLAHEAAINTTIEGKAVVGVTASGEAYDLRLRSGAIGDKVELAPGADGRWHYEFGQGLKPDEFYQNIERPRVISGKTLSTAEIPWLDKKVIDGTVTELILDKTNKGLSVIDFHSRNGQVNGAVFLDSQTREFLPHYVDAALADDHNHYLQLVNESYNALVAKLDKVTEVAGKVGENWTSGAKLEVANFATERAQGSGATQVMHDYAFGKLDVNKLQSVAEHLGSKAPQYLRDADFSSFVSETGVLPKLNPSAAEELWQRGLEYKGKGFKSVDYGFLRQTYEHGRDFAVTEDGKFLSITHSPLTANPIEVPIVDKSRFGADFYHHSKAIVNSIAVSEHTVFNKLKGGLSGEGVRGLMAMAVNDFTPESVRNKFGRSFLGLFSNHNFLDKWQADIASHIKNTSGTSVGERLHNYFVESKGEWGKAGVSEELAKSKAAALEAIQKAEELEARLRAQDAIEKAEKLLNKK